MLEKLNGSRIGRSDADCVVCVLRHLRLELDRDVSDSEADEKRQNSDLYNFLIEFLSEKVDSENCLALWKLGEELDSKNLTDAAVSAVQAR